MICADWITADQLEDCDVDIAGFSTERIGEAITTASEVLFDLSGRRWPGVCTDIVRPCKTATGWTWGDGPFYPVLISGVWQNVSCGCTGSQIRCGCPGVDAIQLPRRPVTEVTEVLIDGAVVTNWELYESGWLVRATSWPCCQNLSRESSEADTWQVTYLYGAAPPTGGQTAARSLAAEILKACTGDQSCRLPARAVSVSRRGITYNLEVASGKTGLNEVDLWLEAVNPHGKRARPRMLSPDDPAFYRPVSAGS